jgi:DNA-binding PadR family transcriptional regulator
LAYGSASGYDLVRVFHGSLAAVWPATQSQIYSELGKLAETGLAEVAAQGMRGRKEYRVTESGLTELRRWLVETRPEKAQRNEMLLRVFLLGAVTREQAVDYLADVRARAEAAVAELAALEQRTDWGEGASAVYGRIALEWGTRFYAMNREWAAWARKQLPQ